MIVPSCLLFAIFVGIMLIYVLHFYYNIYFMWALKKERKETPSLWLANVLVTMTTKFCLFDMH